jgi:hypothetical protein
MLPAAERLPEARELIDEGQYFVVHAPRQTGKTTTLMALAESLTAAGEYAALHFSCEAGEPAGDDYVEAQRAILQEMRRSADLSFPEELAPPKQNPDTAGLSLVITALTAWAQECPRPLVLIFDEIDALRGESLRSVLRQLRTGFPSRPRAFPHSVVLCGLRDVRDYKAESGGDPSRLGTSSPFNIKVKSLRLGDFTLSDVAILYGQHETATGQRFTQDALTRAFELTQGQPWLVNALAREIITEMKVRPPATITVEHVDEAKERLILARETHVDSLVARLNESRVKNVLEPCLAGLIRETPTYEDDFQYVRDLGLIAQDSPVRVANLIYREVIARVLAQGIERKVEVDPRSFVLKDGRLSMHLLLTEFAAFWRLHGDVLADGVLYHEAAPQLVFMAFLHRVVNSGGYVDREYGVGRGRIDLLIRWPYKLPLGERRWQLEAVELKVWRSRQANPREEGLEQLDAYLGRLGLEEGTLIIFDRRGGEKASRARDESERAASAPRVEPVQTVGGRRANVLCL